MSLRIFNDKVIFIKIAHNPMQCCTHIYLTYEISVVQIHLPFHKGLSKSHFALFVIL